MKVERSINDKGETVLTFIEPIPASIDPREYGWIAAIVQRDLLFNLRRDWLKLETKG